jgi:dihydroflavonol-4-reductase
VTRVFVSGASGFIGGALAGRLAERGDDVIGLARSDEAAVAVARRGAAVARGDVLDEDALVAGMAGCEVVYHVAGVNSHCPDNPAMLLRVNVDGARTAVRAARRAGARRVVLTSSAAAIGEPAGTVGREMTKHRGSYLSAYDRSKHHGEQAAFRTARELGIEVVAVNPSSVQGPGRSTGNGKIIFAYLNGRLRAFVDTYVSVVDIEDTVDGHLLAAERGRPGERYLLNGATIPAREALEIVSSLSGVRHRVLMLPPAVARTAAGIAQAVARARGTTSSICPARVRTVLHGHRYDGSRATRELGLAYTPVSETFRRTIDWGVAAGLVNAPPHGMQ